MEWLISGSPAAAAWARSTLVRTPCIATRSASSFTVVSRAADRRRACGRSTCSIQALSFPLLQETRIFIGAA